MNLLLKQTGISKTQAAQIQTFTFHTVRQQRQCMLTAAHEVSMIMKNKVYCDAIGRVQIYNVRAII